MEHLKQASLEVCQAVVDRLASILFDDGLGHIQWITRNNVTRCRLFGAAQMGKNAILCMFKEQLDLGPKYYLLIALMRHSGKAYIQCLLRMLPSEKMVPELYFMRDPLRREPTFPSQREKILAIADRHIPREELPNFCDVV